MDPDRESPDVTPAALPGSQSAAEAATASPAVEPAAIALPATEPGASASPATDSGATDSPTTDSGAADSPLADPPDAPSETDAAELDPADTLSPAVRRLVRQYDLDITGIHGTGPAGKIRVGDVIGMLGGRAEPSPRSGDTARNVASESDDANTKLESSAAARKAEAGVPPGGTQAAVTSGAPTTTVFECNLSRVLSHRKREGRDDVDLLLTSYFAVACAEAFRSVPEIAADEDGRANPPRLGVLVASADSGVRRTLVHAAAESGPDERLRAFDRQLRASDDDDLGAAQLLIHHYGPSGSLLATSTEIGAGHAASVGIGRVRRQIVMKTIDGDEAPRVAAMCYVTLTFVPDRVALNRANRFVAEVVRVLEQWPAEVAG